MPVTQAVNLAGIPLYISQSPILFKKDGGSNFCIFPLKIKQEIIRGDKRVDAFFSFEERGQHLHFIDYRQIGRALGLSTFVHRSALVQS